MSHSTEILSLLDTAEAAATKALASAQKSLNACHAARQRLLEVSEPSAAPGKGSLLHMPSVTEMKAYRKKQLKSKTQLS